MNHESLQRKERWPATVSVALIVINGDRSILLVRKKETGQWALPAGGLQKGETLQQSAFRELFEETGLGADDLDNPVLGIPHILTIPGETKTSIGLVYIMRLKNPLPAQGIKVESDEIDLVLPFSDQQIQELLSQPESIYKPEFNIPAFEEALAWFREF